MTNLLRWFVGFALAALFVVTTPAIGETIGTSPTVVTVPGGVVGVLPFANGGSNAATQATFQGSAGYPEMLGGFADGVSMATSNVDTPITIVSPTPNYIIRFLLIQNVGTTAAPLTAQFGLFPAAGGTGTAIIAGGTTMVTINSNTVNTSVNSQLQGTTIGVTAFNLSTVYFRTTTGQSGVTVNVYVRIEPLP